MDDEWIDAWWEEALSEIALGRKPIGLAVLVRQGNFGPLHFIVTHELEPAQ